MSDISTLIEPFFFLSSKNISKIYETKKTKNVDLVRTVEKYRIHLLDVPC